MPDASGKVVEVGRVGRRRMSIHLVLLVAVSVHGRFSFCSPRFSDKSKTKHGVSLVENPGWMSRDVVQGYTAFFAFSRTVRCIEMMCVVVLGGTLHSPAEYVLSG